MENETIEVYLFRLKPILLVISRDWFPKFATGLNTIISHSSKSIWLIKLSFCQNDPSMGQSFWQKDSLITHTLFELCLIMIFSPVANFGDQSILPYIPNYITRFSVNLWYDMVEKWSKKTLHKTLYS